MSHKKSYDEVKLIVESFNCKLLTTKEEYKNLTSKNQLLLQHSCGETFKRRYILLKQTSDCVSCGIKKRNKTILEKYGVNNISQIKEIKEKKKNTLLQNYGVDNPSKSSEIQQKKKDTCLEKYNVEYYFQSQDKKEKSEITSYEKYNTQYPSQNQMIKNKMKDTNILKYGVEFYSQTDEFKEKFQNTSIKKFGTENPFQNQDIKNKIKKTMIEKYGVEHPMHLKEFFDKVQKTSFLRKEFTLPSGKKIFLQGNEPFCLNILLKQYKEDEILHGFNNMPKFIYKMDDKIKRYYPDFYIPSQNLIIEVKSLYTYNLELEQNILKEKSVLDMGYKYQLYFFNSKGTQINYID